MLERDLGILQRAAQYQGLKQQILSGVLRAGFLAVKALGLRDVPIGGREEVQAPKNPQIERMLSLGFHAELGMSEEQFTASMPPLPFQPERFKGRFDLPVLVDPRVSLPRQLKMHGVLTDLTEAQLTQLAFSMLRAGENTQDPYCMWVEEKITYKNIGSLSWNEQPINIMEAFALIRERPNIFRLLGGFSFDLANLVSEDRIASIEAAGSTRPGSLGFTELNENIKILSSGHFYDANGPQINNSFVCKGRV